MGALGADQAVGFLGPCERGPEQKHYETGYSLEALSNRNSRLAL
jgi:hypothetical protein